MLGIVSSEDFEKELGNSNEFTTTMPLIPINSHINPTAEVVDKPKVGDRGNEVPDSLRRVIGEEAVINGSNAGRELARMFGITSDANVPVYKNGSTSTASYDKQPNLDFLNRARLKISRKAQKTLARAIDQITDDKLIGADASELAGVAKSMSGIIKDMEPEKPKDGSGNNGDSGPKYVFYAPQIKQENYYETIVAKE